MFTSAQIGGLFRAVAAPTVAYAVAKGYVHAGDADWLLVGVTTAATGVWSWWTNRPAALAPKA
jgi:hypothetical protein